uniref:Uncharacterized protein n=1 Tax=Chromera velia CCMP2878 TaxID=1169474 RepID=A0A0G4GFE7_9ALVE|eukprot:Cvel_21559.t1-p1 / transcript=Cvel_21559.t1 / gene=Cvel_21559 / organism=Chromera_velia_CCMP2878 / gene_product=hypothetical protein / transcript_product=hypothetical protein / location=Cvel_scaffold2033:22550-22987(-) / protein_length=146 / sequence_SO=supercontig / SO=protein_coding / is_pseudo=false
MKRGWIDDLTDSSFKLEGGTNEARACNAKASQNLTLVGARPPIVSWLSADAAMPHTWGRRGPSHICSCRGISIDSLDALPPEEGMQKGHTARGGDGREVRRGGPWAGQVLLSCPGDPQMPQCLTTVMYPPVPACPGALERPQVLML